MSSTDAPTSEWLTVATLELPSRAPTLRDPSGLKLSDAARRLLAVHPTGIYVHQHEAIAAYLRGEHSCVATGTASGKSLVFFTSGVEALAADKRAKVLAIYPLKALGHEQSERWSAALKAAGVAGKVGRVDGSVPMGERTQVLRDSRVLVMTPDVIHAWLLANAAEAQVQRFLHDVRLVVVDEVHAYNGVFGSNAAFLFRRLQHAMSLAGGRPRFVCASATIASPQKHLAQLLGLEFVLVGPEQDSSARQPITVELARPPAKPDLLTSVSGLLRGLAQQGRRFLAFVDSRKQAELVASIVMRRRPEEEGETALEADAIEKSDILPYRSGYEEEDRARIQERLRSGSLGGVVSTSALELGLDISGMDTVVLLGVPRSATSLHQRIGRVGRHAPGRVLVVHSGDVLDEAVFADPPSILRRPLAEGALYLENPRIQYIHALCLARAGGEHDLLGGQASEGGELRTAVGWPEGFLDVCRGERLGEIPVDLQSMKSECGDDPNRTFPLRDVESQFQVVLKQGPAERGLGSLSYGQVLREAYPGAVYYYVARPNRVYRIDTRARKIHVRSEKRYVTKPTVLPTLVFPNLSADRVFRRRRHGGLVALECPLQVREAVVGYRERRGAKELPPTSYPLAMSDGLMFRQPRFVRNFFTTGVVLTHPALDGDGVDGALLAQVFLEALLMLVPFERQDVSVAIDKHRAARGDIAPGQRFLALYDQTYGSLRLSGRLVEGELLARTVSLATELCDTQFAARCRPGSPSRRSPPMPGSPRISTSPCPATSRSRGPGCTR